MTGNLITFEAFIHVCSSIVMLDYIIVDFHSPASILDSCGLFVVWSIIEVVLSNSSAKTNNIVDKITTNKRIRQIIIHILSSNYFSLRSTLPDKSNSE